MICYFTYICILSNLNKKFGLAKWLIYVFINAVFLLSGSEVSSQWRLTAVTAHRQLWVCALSGLAWFE